AQQNLPCDDRADRTAATMQIADFLNQLCRRAAFQQIPCRTCLDRADDVHLVAKDGKYHDLTCGPALLRRLDQPDTAAVRQSQIDQHDIGWRLHQQSQTVRQGSGMPGQYDIRCEIKRFLQVLAELDVV